MSTVVQSTCPGCRQALRIPSDWITQAIRCKQCGMVLQAKAPVYAPRSSGIRPSLSSRTPPPPSRPVAAPSQAIAMTPSAPTLPPVAVAAPVGAAPLAVAVAAAPVAAGSPFDMIDGDESAAPSRPSRYRRNRGSWWKGPAIAAAVLVVAGLGTLLAWPYLREAFQAPAASVAHVDNNTQDPNTVTPTDSPKPKDEPKKDPKTKDLPAKPKDPPSKPKDPNPKPNDPSGKPKDPTDKPSDPPSKPADPVKPPPKGAPVFPRRALVISVHDYLYANPVDAGMQVGVRNIPHFLDALNTGLHIPMTEMAHLSDAAEKGQARAPMKSIIEKTLTDFLDSSRGQDRIMVFFIGHAVMVGDDAYLVPIEGELDNADSLIPLKWVYEQMAKCKARQKVLVMDVNRLNPAHGLERPNGGPMDPKMDAALAAPPEGVQVWTACVAGQQSYELDEYREGIFIDKLHGAFAPDKGDDEKGLGEGFLQHPEDPLPLDRLCELVNGMMKDKLTPYKLEQQSRLAGSEPKDGAAFDRAEAPAPTPTLASAGPSGSPKEIQGVLDEVGVPALKASAEDSSVRFEVLPPFPADKMASYPAAEPDDAHKALRDAIKNAREVVWAINTAAPPTPLAADVQKKRMELKANLSILKDGYRKPPDEAKFKDVVLKDEREVADLMAACEDALQTLKAAGDDADKGRATEAKRWQVNYDFTLARLQEQYAYLFEYQSMLGQMRKQLPDLAPGQNGWKLASQETLKGDSQGKNLAKAARKLLDQIIKDNSGTPWEVLAKREKLTALGLKWEGTKSE